MTVTELLNPSELTDAEIQRRWEEAYIRFETPEEEIKKFVRRLTKLGEKEWSRDAKIVEIFCGRGNGLKALETLGFEHLEGVDISAELLARYDGVAKTYEADCRNLPFDDASREIVIVQGGLHHLSGIPEDLDRTLGEVNRILKTDGLFLMVEPWLTPFLRLIHFLSDIKAVRSVSNRFDAFATMTHYEASTYFNWLKSAEEISVVLQNHFVSSRHEIKWGKIYFVGSPKR